MLKPEPLLIDIETLLKMCRFVPSFKAEFEKNKYLTDNDKIELEEYVKSAIIPSKSHMWGFLNMLEHISEANKAIIEWRGKTTDYRNIERVVKKTPEKSFSHSIIGRIIKSNKHKELISEVKTNKFQYNSMALINSGTDRLYFFY